MLKFTDLVKFGTAQILFKAGQNLIPDNLQTQHQNNFEMYVNNRLSCRVVEQSGKRTTAV